AVLRSALPLLPRGAAGTGNARACAAAPRGSAWAEDRSTPGAHGAAPRTASRDHARASERHDGGARIFRPLGVSGVCFWIPRFVSACKGLSLGGHQHLRDL